MKTETMLDARARELAGNWRRWECFAWFNRPDDGAERWAIVYTHNRDSGILDESNGEEIKKLLDPFTIDDGEQGRPDVIFERHSHSMVGYVEGFSIRVYRPDGSVTPAFEAYSEILDLLDNYPVLNETDFSNREYEAALVSIQQTIDDLEHKNEKEATPTGAAEAIFEYLWREDQSELENVYGDGASPSSEAVLDALCELYPDQWERIEEEKEEEEGETEDE